MAGFQDARLADTAWLQEQYVELRKTTTEISDLIGCSKGSAWYALKAAGIPLRGRHEARKLADKDCLVCGATFTPAGTSAKYCLEHQTRSSRVKSRVCNADFCSNTFKPKMSGTKYCSEECRYGTAVCEICKKEFIKRPESRSVANRFCNDSCRKLGLVSSAKYEYTNRGGYKIIIHPVSKKQVSEHRYVMEQLLGRPLEGKENVHHINGQRSDNTVNGPLVNWRSGNLELWSTHQPKGQYVADKVRHAIEVLQKYAPEKIAQT